MDFTKEVLDSKLPVLVDFWAPWCGPCRAVAPLVERIASENKDKLKVVKVNVDENPELPAKYAFSSIPTLILFENGKEVDRVTGFNPGKIEEMVKKGV